MYQRRVSKPLSSRRTKRYEIEPQVFDRDGRRIGRAPGAECAVNQEQRQHAAGNGCGQSQPNRDHQSVGFRIACRTEFFSDGVIATLRYGMAERIDSNVGAGGFDADMPLLNRVNRYSAVPVDMTLKF
jgi:hypothetical protein